MASPCCYPERTGGQSRLVGVDEAPAAGRRAGEGVEFPTAGKETSALGGWKPWNAVRVRLMNAWACRGLGQMLANLYAILHFLLLLNFIISVQSYNCVLCGMDCSVHTSIHCCYYYCYIKP
jgi:hypothetical protein